jgi:hypothetical protein
MTDRADEIETLRHAAANERSERLRAQERHDARIAGIRRLHADSAVVTEDVDTDLRQWLERVDPSTARKR